MIDQLFGSKTRVKLLKLFLGNPNRAFYVREITRKIDEQINSVRRELANLLKAGIISSESTNNRLYYEVNQNSEHYEALRMLFGLQDSKAGDSSKKSVPVTRAEDNSIAAHLKEAGAIEFAILTGVFTREHHLSIDLLVVGDVNKANLAKAMKQVEAQENRDVRYASMSVKDFEYRQEVHDRFLADIMNAKKTIIINSGRLFDTPQEDEKETK